MDLYEKIEKMYATPDTKPFLFQIGQKVRLALNVSKNGQTPIYWDAAIVTVVSRYVTGMWKDHWYKLRHKNGQCEDFKEYEINRRYSRKNKHFIHYLSQEGSQLIHPSESEMSQGGSFYAPFNGEYPDRLQVHAVKHSTSDVPADPETFEVTSVTNESETIFVLLIKEMKIVFTDSDFTFSSYTGKLKHFDFKSPLVRIRPIHPEILDELLEKTGYCIFGCDHYRK